MPWNPRRHVALVGRGHAHGHRAKEAPARLLERREDVLEVVAHASVLLGDLWRVDHVLECGVEEFGDRPHRDGDDTAEFVFRRVDTSSISLPARSLSSVTPSELSNVIIRQRVGAII